MLAVTVMWVRCVLNAPQTLDTDYDGVGEDARPAAGNRLCVAKFQVENTGTAPAPYYASSELLVTGAGSYGSSGVASELAGALKPVEGEDRNSTYGLNPRQVGYTFGAWEVPDDVAVQAVQYTDGQQVAVDAQRLDSL